MGVSLSLDLTDSGPIYMQDQMVWQSQKPTVELQPCMNFVFF